MTLRKKERRIARGIYWTPFGWRLYVRIGGRLRSKRIKDRGHELSLKTLREHLDAHRVDARRRAHVPAPSAPGSFAEEARLRYLPAVKAMPGIKERTYHIELWIQAFGARTRSTIKPWEIAQVRDRWLTEGPRRVCRPWDPTDPDRPTKPTTGKWVDVAEPLSASQVNNRLRALENLWTVLDGRHAYNPVREAGEASEPESRPRAIPYDTIDALLEQMPDRGRARKGEKRTDVSFTKLRLRALAYNGLSHGELMALRQSDLHLNDPSPWVWVSGRKKGKGTTGAPQPVTAKGADALRALAAAGGLGTFSPDSMRKSFTRTAAKLNLAGLRPYDLRHSFATELLEHTGGNLSVTQMLMRHRDPRTTLRYAAAAVDPAKVAALQRVEQSGGFGSKRSHSVPTARRARGKRR